MDTRRIPSLTRSQFRVRHDEACRQNVTQNHRLEGGAKEREAYGVIGLTQDPPADAA